MLTEEQCNLIEMGLTESVEPRKVAAYLCLHMGLTLSEVVGLRWADIDVDSGTIALRNHVGKPEGASTLPNVEFLPLNTPRVLPMPPHVRRYLRENASLYTSDDCFLMTSETALPAFYMMQNILTSICLKYKLNTNLSVSDLRNTFIRRCIQCGVDLYTLCNYVGIKQPNVILKRFREYFTPRMSQINRIEKYAKDYVPEPVFDPDAPKRMNLLILGAGSQGPVVKEIAEAIGIFDEIAFLDDDPNNKLAIGPLKDLEKLKYRYPMGIASFGDSFLRERYMNELEKSGYVVPSMIHPSATLSLTAVLGRSVVIEARCVVSASAEIGRGALISSASVIEVGAKIGQFVHIGSSVTVAKGVSVPDYTRVPSGSVIRAK